MRNYDLLIIYSVLLKFWGYKNKVWLKCNYIFLVFGMEGV